MKTTHTLFFAIPFDSATVSLYHLIRRKIKDRYNSNVTTVIGNKEVGPSPKYSSIASFKSQNRELNDQFVKKIQNADIVIADLTNSNPNVHVELGIALQQNKNILRVTGRPESELGFDIRNLEVHRYKDSRELTQIIYGYLDTFFEIKRLSFSKRSTSLYREESHAISLDGSVSGFEMKRILQPNFELRDGAIRVEFEILSANNPDDWFGVYFRARTDPFAGSYLLYVRQNGKFEIAVYPGHPEVLKVASVGKQLSGRQKLTIEFENNYLDVQLGNAELHFHRLSHQEVGSVWLAALQAKTKAYSAKAICRDTIEKY